MASSLSISRASAVMGSILDRSIDIPRDISFRGDLTLVDRSGAGEATLKQENLLKLVDILDGIVLSNKAVITDSNKNIIGVNSQTNTGQFIFDKSGDEEEGAVDLVFKRARGNATNKSETFHGNHIGVLSFQPYVGTSYIDSAGIEINTYKTSYSSKYSGSEIIFSNSGGSDINSGKHDSLKIDAKGNLNILKSREIRLNAFRDTNYSGFRPSTSTLSPGYVLELPPEKGEYNQVLSINKVGKGGQITMVSDSLGVITSATISAVGQDYDKDYHPEVNTNVKMTGSTLRENGEVSNITSNQKHNITSTGITATNPAKLTINPSPIMNGDEITVDTMDGNMGTDILTGNTYYVKVTNNISSSVGIPNNTTVIGGGGTTTITISNNTTAIIPSGTTITFTFGSGEDSQTRTVDSEVAQGSNTIVLTTAAPFPSTGGLNVTELELYTDTALSTGVDTTGKTSSGVGTHTIPADIFLSTISSSNNNYYNGWIIETINPNSERIIINYKGLTKKTLLSSSIPDTSITTQYKLKQGHGLSKISRNNASGIYTLNTFSSLYSTSLSSVVDYYNNWTIIVDVTYDNESFIHKGQITSYNPTGSIIEVTWVNAIPLNDSNEGEVTVNNNNCALINETIIPATVKIKGINDNGTLISGANGVELLDGGSGYIPNQSNITINLPSQTKLQWVAQNASSFTSPNSVITTGKGLAGGGNISGNINIDLDLSTHDAAGISSNGYQSLSTDKLLVYNPVSGESHMPDRTNFLNSIVGTGLSTDSLNGNLIISNSQSIVSNISDNFKIYSSSDNEKIHYLNIGKDDSDNIKIKGEYKTSEDLGIQPNTTVTTRDNNTITISNRTTAIIPAQTTINFTYPNQSTTETAVTSTAIPAGNNTLGLSEIPSTISVTTNITEITGIPSNTIVTASDDTTNSITISNDTTAIIPQDTVLTFTFANQGDETRVVSADAPSGQKTIVLTSAAPTPPPITIEITPEKYLNKTIIQTQSSKTNNDSTIQFDIGTKSEIVNIDQSGLSVKKGIIESITITSGGSGYLAGDVLVIGPPPSGPTFPSSNQSNYTAEGKLVLDSSGTITDIIIIYCGLGYSSTTPPTATVVPKGSSPGSGATFTVQVNDSRYIMGEINNYNVRYDGYFKDLYIAGDQNFQGTLKVTGQGAVELGKPSNLDFSENDTSFIFGYEAGGSGTGSIRETTNKDVTYIGHRAGYNSTTYSQYNTFIGSSTGNNNTGASVIEGTVDTYNTEGTRNTYVGYSAGSSGTISQSSVCLGYLAGGFLTGSYNTSIGSNAGYGSSDNSSGHSGNYNVYLGYGVESRDGSYNLFAGSNAGKLSTSSNGVFLGYESGLNSTGDGNVLIGYHSGYTSTSSLYNVLIGYESGYNISTNDSTISPNYTGNIMMGYKSGYNLAGKSSRNIIIGPNAGPPSGGDNIYHNKIYISTRGESLTPLILGDQDTANSQTLNFNADVTISKENSSGTLNVKGGVVNIYGPYRASNDANASTYGKIWALKIENGGNWGPYKDVNLSLTNHSGAIFNDSGTSGANLTYGNILIGLNVGNGGSGQTVGTDNILIGKNVAENKSNIGIYNTVTGSSAAKDINGASTTSAYGYYSLTNITDGGGNSAFGKSSGYNITSGEMNSCFGQSSGYKITTGNYNICIGQGTGPTSGQETHHNRLYIDVGTNDNTTGTGANSLIYGNQSGTTHTLSLNANITINKQQGGGNLTVEGGEIKFFDKTLRDGDTTNGKIWIISSPGSSSSSPPNGNLVISNDTNPMNNSNFSSLMYSDAYKDTTIIGYNVGARGHRTTILGSSAGYPSPSYGGTDDNTFIGFESGSYFTASANGTIQQNTFIGSESGKGFNETKSTICIGYKAGFASGTNETTDNLLIIDASGSSNGSDSIIYGNQSGSTHTLSLNADVTIKNGANSSGNLDIEGALTCSTLSAPLSDVSFKDNNIDVEPTVGRTNFDYNLLFSNNSNTVNFTDIEKTTIFGTFSTHIDITANSHSNTLFGHECGNEITTGYRNTLLGVGNARLLTTGYANTMLGVENLYSTQTAYGCVGIGYRNMYNTNSAGSRYYNIGIGYQNCLYVQGLYNVGIGSGCLQGTNSDGTLSYCVGIGGFAGCVSTGNHNNFMGWYSGYHTTGDKNTGVGSYALRNLKGGESNVALGYDACRGATNSTFDYNTGVGYSALYSLSTGNYNVAIGKDAGYNIDEGHNNVCLGQSSGKRITTGDRNISLGRQSGEDTTIGNDNISIGPYAGKQTTGSKNISIGYDAGPSTSDIGLSDKLYIDNSRQGTSSLIYGDMHALERTIKINGDLEVTGTLTTSSLGSITADVTGGLTVPSNKSISIPSINQVTISSTNTNMYLGYQSGWGGVRSGSSVRNTYFGYRSGRQSNTSADNNTYIGMEAGYNGTSGEINTAVGVRALYSCTTGVRNTCLGFYTGYYVTSGSYNTCLGYNAGPTGPSSSSYNLYIDPIYRRGTDSLIYGYGYGTTTRWVRTNAKFYVKSGYAAYASYWYTYSDISLKKDIFKIDEKINDKIDMLEPVNYTLKSNDKKEVGFIAQEVKKVFPLLVSKDKDGLLTVDYPKLTTYIVKGMQENNKIIKDLEKKLDEEKEKRENMEKFFTEEIEKLRKEILRK